MLTSKTVTNTVKHGKSDLGRTSLVLTAKAHPVTTVA